MKRGLRRSGGASFIFRTLGSDCRSDAPQFRELQVAHQSVVQRAVSPRQERRRSVLGVFAVAAANAESLRARSCRSMSKIVGREFSNSDTVRMPSEYSTCSVRTPLIDDVTLDRFENPSGRSAVRERQNRRCARPARRLPKARRTSGRAPPHTPWEDRNRPRESPACTAPLRKRSVADQRTVGPELLLVEHESYSRCRCARAVPARWLYLFIRSTPDVGRPSKTLGALFDRTVVWRISA